MADFEARFTQLTHEIWQMLALDND